MRKILSLLAVLVLLSVSVFAQTKTVSGKVTDQVGAPVPFVSILIKGSKVGTSADADGRYSIKASASDILVVSGATINKKEFPVGTGATLDIQVTHNESNLSEVVVTALGIRRQPKEVGYSTTKIGAGELNEAKVTNVATGLAAKVSGLQVNLVNNSVKPDVRITLRGNRSILGNNQALLVVDDVILPVAYLSSINPNDVDNVTVLKGASASALYGSAASNGVLIVTTKKGRGKPQIRVSSTYNIEEISYMPKLQNRFGQNGGENDPNQFPGVIVFPSDPFHPYVPYENQNYGPEFNGQQVTVGGPVRIYRADGTFFDSTMTGIYSAKPDAKKGFFDKGRNFQNDISYSVGDDKSRFFLSFQDVDIKGIIPKDVSHRNTVRINGSRTTGKFTADYNIGYTISHSNTTPGSGVPFKYGTSDFGGGFAGGGSYFQNRPVYWTVINTPADIDLRQFKDWSHNPFFSPDGYFNAYYGNPWWQIDQTRLDERYADLVASGSLTFKATDWLSAMYRASILRDDYNNKYTQAGYTFADWAIADPLGAGNIPSAVKKYNPSEGDAFSTNQRFISDFLVSAEHKFNKLDAHLILGNQVVNNYFRQTSVNAPALVIPDFYNVSNILGTTPGFGESKSQTRTYGVFGDLTLGWNGFLFLHGSLRNDWTSLLSTANRSYLYPAVDASFVFSEIMPHAPSWFSYGKLRAAYSKTAQVSIGPYGLTNVFGTAPGFPGSIAAGFTLGNQFANSDIKPEFTTEKEIGLELGFLKNRININIAAYDDNTTNQTIPITITPTTGYSSALVNSGEMQNRGVEIDVKFSPIIRTSSGFRWDIGANFSYNQNKLLSIGYGLSSIPVGGNSYAVIGNPYPVIKTNDWLRDDGGHIIVDQKNGLPSLDPTQKYFGTTNPPTKIGLTTSLSYKGLTLNAVADGRFGAVILNSIGSDLDFTGVSWYSTQSGRQSFVLPNSVYKDGSGKYVPNTNVSVNDGNNLFWASTWNAAGSNYVSSADFWKLRELSLTYELPKSLFRKMDYVHGVSVGIVGRNLVTWKAKGNSWTDPEFSNTNGNGIGTTDINQTPPTKFYGANVTVTF